MTGDNKTPQPQWPAADSTPTIAEPVTRRKSRSEAVAGPFVEPLVEPPEQHAAQPPQPSSKSRAAAKSVAAASALPAATAQPAAVQPPTGQEAAAQPPAAPARLPEFGNGNIFGEAFATLLDQVEAAKQHERQEEERAAQEALARTLSDKLRPPQTQPAAQPAPAAPIPVPITPTPITPSSAGSDFASRARAYAQATPLTATPLTATPLAAEAPLAAVPVSVQPAPIQPAPVQPVHSMPASSSTQVYIASPTAPAVQDAPLVSELHGLSETGHGTGPSQAQDVPPDVLAHTPSLPDQPLPSLSYAMPSQVSILKPRFASSGPFLARFLPDVPSSHTGIQAGFCNLHDFLGYLHEQNWYGYLYAALGEQAAYVLVYEGRTVAAACLSSTGEQALGELLHLYEQGAHLSAYPLDDYLAHILSGVGSRAWKFNLTDDFTGLHAKPDEAIYYYQGRVVATMPAGLPYEGAFPAPLRPQTLVLPRSLAGWAHHSYAATLRGRDALNAITPAHQMFKAKFGAAGLGLQAALLEGLTPAEYALRHDTPLHELEPVVHELVQLGYLKDE